MECPYCQSTDTRVLETRENDTNDLRRRRMCNSCKSRFTTIEIVETQKITVLKKDFRKEPFDRAKLTKGIEACTRNIGISTETFNQLIAQIYAKVAQLANYPGNKSVISSTQIGDIVLDSMFELNQVAYIRYASVFKKFSSVDDFIEEIKRFTKLKPKSQKSKVEGK